VFSSYTPIAHLKTFSQACLTVGLKSTAIQNSIYSSLYFVFPHTHLTSFDLTAILDACVYGHEDCHGRENCEPFDGPFGECRCDRFLGFTGSSCGIPTSTTYVLVAMMVLVAASSVAVVVVCSMIKLAPTSPYI